ncbi:4'-phosphopantetheine phosphatase [Harmonia axyridis]|uniref:4'-phosphopantetheine phosphatase n=1 Tax=Harmonia axyridis TaxID=115357 RepID=UPI001E27806F|nr:4'-phosphopantetheine phosphatase [Harmonia axyridis]
MDYERSVCPVLKNPQSYDPDTIDLQNDIKQREYWLTCLDQMIKKFIPKASILNPEDLQATEKAEKSYQTFHMLTEQLKDNPRLLNPLSVRTLLEFNEDNLRTNNFKDAWSIQKQKETALAFNKFSARLKYIDSIEPFRDRWLEVVKGVLAGNVFDWGSKVVSEMLEKSPNFDLLDAMKTIQPRPWFKDDFELFVNKIETCPYKKVVIFVDNAGIDFVLGILPFARELLKLGTKVILVGNTLPALNDVTFKELKSYLVEASHQCGIFRNALNENRLQCLENGQRGPCLDLTSLPEELCETMLTTDCVIIEGMGRAVQTNFYATFTIDCLKLAVLKNEWLAKSLGASQFFVICDFQIATSST